MIQSLCDKHIGITPWISGHSSDFEMVNGIRNNSCLRFTGFERIRRNDFLCCASTAFLCSSQVKSTIYSVKL